MKTTRHTQIRNLVNENGQITVTELNAILNVSEATIRRDLEEMDQLWIPVNKTWRLNERHYGALQGLNKSETSQKFGEEQVLIWRRSYNIPPPALEPNDPRYPGNEPRYASLSREDLPLTESLELTVKRMMPFINETLHSKN